MNELIDQHILNLIDGLYASVGDNFLIFIADAQALAAIFMLLYFSIESFGMMTGDKKLEIMPLLRPFALGIVLMFWLPFVGVILFPAGVLTDKAKNTFYEQRKEVAMLSRVRYGLVDSVAMKLIETSFEVEHAGEEAKDKSWMKFGIDLTVITKKIAGMNIYVISKIKSLFYQGIEYICVAFWQVCTYLIFFLQVIFVSVLIIIGPIAFALSIIPAFRDSYIHWLARIISVSLYSCLAYIVLFLSLNIMKYALIYEIDIMRSALGNEAIFIVYTGMSSGGIATFIVTCILGGISMLTIPIMSTWIVSTSGAGQAVAGMAAGAAMAAKGITRMAGTK